MCGKKYYIWNPSTCDFENDEYLGSIIDESVNLCNKIIETNLNLKRKHIK